MAKQEAQLRAGAWRWPNMMWQSLVPDPMDFPRAFICARKVLVYGCSENRWTSGLQRCRMECYCDRRAWHQIFPTLIMHLLWMPTSQRLVSRHQRHCLEKHSSNMAAGSGINWQTSWTEDQSPKSNGSLQDSESFSKMGKRSDSNAW